MWISTIRLQSFSRASRRISSGKLPQFDRHLKVSSDRYAWVETKSWDLTFVWILSMVAMVTAKQNCSLVVLVLNPCEAFTRKTAVQKCVLPSYLLWVWILFLFVLHKICVASDFYLYSRCKAEGGSNAEFDKQIALSFCALFIPRRFNAYSHRLHHKWHRNPNHEETIWLFDHLGLQTGISLVTLFYLLWSNMYDMIYPQYIGPALFAYNHMPARCKIYNFSAFSTSLHCTWHSSTLSLSQTAGSRRQQRQFTRGAKGAINHEISTFKICSFNAESFKHCTHVSRA